MDGASGFLDDESLPLSGSGFYHFSLVSKDRCFVLQSPLVGDVAVVNEKMRQVIESVLELDTTRLSAYSGVQEWNSIGKGERKSRKNIHVSVDMNIYGSGPIRDRLSKLLSSNHVYLQHPAYQEYDTYYNNPHFVEIPGILLSSSVLPDPSAPDNDDTAENGPSNVSTQVKIDEAVSAVFHSLTRLKRLDKLEADFRIKTPLLT